MPFISLFNGMAVEVDAADHTHCSQHQWFVLDDHVAWRAYAIISSTPVLMSQWLTGAAGRMVKHRNSNSLDCRRENLRADVGLYNVSAQLKFARVK